MKNLLILIILSIGNQLFAQNQTANCKVLSEKLQGKYDGECKNRLANGEGTAKGKETYSGSFKEGLPHGKGKYVYENGSFYIGEFKNGLRHGEGEMHEYNKTSDKIEEGKLAKWKNDQFVEYILEKKYKVIQSLNTLSFNFDKPDETQEKVEIMLGTRSVLNGINVQLSSGDYYELGANKIVIQNCSFPLTVRLNYSAQKGISSSTSVRLDFELESKGHWKVNVNSQ
ncbi:MAG: hypothetical protein ABI844_08765 [Saprospiraceae bacterium]